MDKKALARLEQLNQIKLDEAQRDDVLSFFEKREEDLATLDAIDTANVEPMVHVIPTQIALREDVIEQSVGRTEVQAQAPVIDAGYFCVPRVID